jgi:hypothetical protein
VSELSDHDLLIRIDERVHKLDRCMTNHLAHHWSVSVAVLGAVLTALASLIVALGTQ